MKLDCKSFYIQYYPYRVFFEQDVDDTEFFKCIIIHNYISNKKDIVTLKKFYDEGRYVFRPLHKFVRYNVSKQMFEKDFYIEHAEGLYKSFEGAVLVKDEIALSELIGEHFEDFL